MATVIRDSLKPYKVVADAAQNMWDIFAQSNLTYTFVKTPNTRYSTDSQALQITAGAVASDTIVAQKASGSNDGSVFAFFAFINNRAFTSGDTSWMIQFQDGGTPQCTVEFTALGVINVRTGGKAGTIVATFSSAFSQEQWNGWLVNVVIGSSGSVHIRKNGAATDTFVATGINTQATSNAYAQTYLHLVPANPTGSGLLVTIQDLWFYNGTGALPNSALPNDVRTFWQSPNSASQTQFSAGSLPTPGPTDTSGTQSLVANTEYCGPGFVPTFNGTVSSVALNFNAGATGSFIMGIYDNTGAGGGPGALLATSSVVTNPGAGSNAFAFSSHPTLSNSSTYYFAVLSNTSYTLVSSSTVNSGYSLSQSYGSGFTNPGAMNSVSISTYVFAITYQAANFTNVSELFEDGSASTISSSTAGQEDRYGVAPIPVTPTQIYGLQLRAFGQKSDSGARSGAVTVTSGGVNQAGTSVALTTSFENIAYNQDVDPNTSAAWAPAAVNAALIGVKVAA